MNDAIKIKTIARNYLSISLRSFIPIPFIVAILSLFKLEQDTFITIAFLCSVIVIELLRFKKLNEKAPLKRRLTDRFDLSVRKPTDTFMYGAIAAKADRDSLMSSLELEKEALEVYKWCGL